MLSYNLFGKSTDLYGLLGHEPHITFCIISGLLYYTSIIQIVCS